MPRKKIRREDSEILDSGVGESGEVEIPSCCDAQDLQYYEPPPRGNTPSSLCRNTIKQHYYPEGGWGWTIVFCGVLVQCLTHGLHLSWGVVEIQVRKKFFKTSVTDTGL